MKSSSSSSIPFHHNTNKPHKASIPFLPRRFFSIPRPRRLLIFLCFLLLFGIPLYFLLKRVVKLREEARDDLRTTAEVNRIINHHFIIIKQNQKTETINSVKTKKDDRFRLNPVKQMNHAARFRQELSNLSSDFDSPEWDWRCMEVSREKVPDLHLAKQLCPPSAYKSSCSNSKSASELIINSIKKTNKQGLSFKKQRKINWSDIVIGIPTYQNVNQTRIVHAQLQTVFSHVQDAGLDLVIVTDQGDTRTDEEILTKPISEKMQKKIKSISDSDSFAFPSVHVYRSEAKQEGIHARFKVIDMFSYLLKTYPGEGEDGDSSHHPLMSLSSSSEGPGRGKGSPWTSSSSSFKMKKYFFKLDPDTILVPAHLLALLDQIEQSPVGGIDQDEELFQDAFPIQLGSALCHDRSRYHTCHGSGAFYGFNRAALYTLISFFALHPDSPGNGWQDAHTPYLEHEDFLMAWALRYSTGVPILDCGGIYSESPRTLHRMQEEEDARVKQGRAGGQLWASWPLAEKPICFHHLEDGVDAFDRFECYYYDKKRGVDGGALVDKMDYSKHVWNSEKYPPPRCL